MSSIDNSRGEAIRRARLRHGLTQSELAAQAGFSQAQVSGWETGRIHPSDEQAHGPQAGGGAHPPRQSGSGHQVRW